MKAGRRGSPRTQPPGASQGLALSWQVYRGAGAVSSAIGRQPSSREKRSTTVTFSEPGDYMLHLLAIDSRTANRCCWTNGYVKVTVEAGAAAPVNGRAFDGRAARWIAGMHGDHGGQCRRHCENADARSKGAGT